MTRLATLVLLVLVALVLFASFAQAGQSFTFCNPFTCSTNDREEAGAAATTLSSLEALSEDEEVVLDYTQEVEDAQVEDASDVKPFTSPNGQTFDCKSNCKAVFAGSGCDRCTYPYAYYNKEVTPLKLCFPTVNDIKLLSEQDQTRARDMCIKYGECSCQRYERLESYLNSACVINCKLFGYPNRPEIYMQLEDENAKCENYQNPANKATFAKVKSECQKQTMGLTQLIKSYGASASYFFNLWLTNATVNGATLTPTEEFSKAMNATFKPTFSDYIFAIDTFTSDCRKKQWSPEIRITNGQVSLGYKREFSRPKDGGKTSDAELTKSALNEANKMGFNDNNAAAAGFESHVTSSATELSVYFLKTVVLPQAPVEIIDYVNRMKNGEQFVKTARNAQSAIEKQIQKLYIDNMPGIAAQELGTLVNDLRLKYLRIQNRFSASWTWQTVTSLYVANQMGSIGAHLHVGSYSQKRLGELRQMLTSSLKKEWITRIDFE